MKCKGTRATPLHVRTAINGSSIKSAEYQSRGRVLESRSQAGPRRALADVPGGAETRKLATIAGLGIVGLMLCPGAASAGTATGNLPVQVTIVSDCKVQSAAALDFGSQGVLDSALNGATTLGIQCTNTTPYNVRLDAGAGAGATIASRLMTLAAATVSYNLYRDAARTLVWGVTDGTNTVAGTGNGAVQTLNVYGQIPAQTTPAPGLYTDTVLVTVAW